MQKNGDQNICFIQRNFGIWDFKTSTDIIHPVIMANVDF